MMNIRHPPAKKIAGGCFFITIYVYTRIVYSLTTARIFAFLNRCRKKMSMKFIIIQKIMKKAQNINGWRGLWLKMLA